MRDSSAFAREQTQLATVWTFLGLARDLENDGDWFTASLATREVFVQRFGERVRAFENLCPHRFHPIRTQEKGNGPIICGFHHWQFNSEGLAVGIPICREVFASLPHELGAQLNVVEVDTCGQMIFGRFASASRTELLADYLGDAYPILSSLTAMTSKPRKLNEQVNANWRLLYHITLDDYHGVAVHPTTFGKTGYLELKDVQYHRFGHHSAFLTPAEDGDFQKMTEDFREGAFRPERYSIFQIFPNLVVVLLLTDRNHWFGIIQQYVPLAHDRTRVRNWVYPAPFPNERDWRPKWARPVPDRIRMEILLHYVRRVLKEDHRTCERIQQGIKHIDRSPIPGAFEERIVWFESTYRNVTGSD